MKCFVAVVVLAVVAAANASVLPLGWGGIPAIVAGHHGLHGLDGTHHGLVAAHGVVVGHHGLVAGHGLDWHGHDDGQWVDDVHHHGVYAHGHAVHVPAVHVAHAHAHVLPVHVAHEGSYVAANRGSVHVAPLAGHIQSASSINLQPAPGTL